MNEATAPSTSPREVSTGASYAPPGMKNIVPYILVNGAARFIDFLRAAFEAEERLRVPLPDGSVMHAEVGIGDSVVEVADASEKFAPRPTTIHLYVKDADATYGRALRAGATSLEEVSDQPWGDRQGVVKDPFGNVWNIGMPKGWLPGPDGPRSVQPFLNAYDAHKLMAFAEAAFGAEAHGVAESPEGQVLHATMQMNYGTMEIADAQGERQPMPGYFHVYFADADKVYAAALEAGATSVEAPVDKDYGERSAIVKDPFGNTWFLATYLGR
jgi:PhnB protein